MVEASRRKGSFNAWEIKVLNSHTRTIRRLYLAKDIDRFNRLVISRRARKQALEAKSNIPIFFNAKMSRNERNMVKNYQEKF